MDFDGRTSARLTSASRWRITPQRGRSGKIAYTSYVRSSTRRSG